MWGGQRGDDRGRAGETIRVLSWRGGWGRALRTAVSSPFARAHGVTVEHVPHVGLKLPESLTAALERGEPPPVDVIWSNGVPALRAAQAGYAGPLEIAAQPASRALFARAFPEGTARARVVHPYVVYYVLAYHERALSGRAPRSWEALLEPRHRGKIALYPGGNGFYPIAQTMGGGDVTHLLADPSPCWRFVRALRRQIGMLDYSIGMEEHLGAGRLTLCFRALTNALAFRSAGLPIGWCVPDEGTTDALDALWIPRGLSPAAERLAQRFVAFALTPEVQTRWCEELGAMPVHPRAKIPEILRTRPNLPRHADDQRGILSLPEAIKVAHEHEWEETFTQVMAGR